MKLGANLTEMPEIGRHLRHPLFVSAECHKARRRATLYCNLLSPAALEATDRQVSRACLFSAVHLTGLGVRQKFAGPVVPMTFNPLAAPPGFIFTALEYALPKLDAIEPNAPSTPAVRLFLACMS